MVYYIKLDGEEYEFDHCWELFEFANFNKLKSLQVIYIQENGKAKKYNFYDNGHDRVFPVTDEFGQQVLDKNRRPVKKIVERWKLVPA